MDHGRIIIRNFRPSDRGDIRRISCDTAFLEMNHERIFNSPEIVADALTLYFTDYEPQSSFVAESSGKVIGYIIGSTDVRSMRRVLCCKVVPHMIWRMILKRTFMSKINWALFMRVWTSFIKGEFFLPVPVRQYPATLHINIDKPYRGQHVGAALMNHYLEYLKRNHVQGVHLATYSESARKFFEKTDRKSVV